MMPPHPETSRPTARMGSVWWQTAVILLAGLFIYAPVFSGGWLMDDNLEVTDNLALRDAAGLLKIWRGEAGADYLPLKSTLQWVLWQGFGGQPTPYHLVSIALHLGSALLLWRLLRRLGMNHPWLGGLLFSVHPILVESVAWVSELKNTLSLAILLLAMLAWLSFDEWGRRRDFAGALVLFIAALLCKASVIMFPVVILLHAGWKRGRVDRKDLAASLPFFAVALAAAAATVFMQNQHAIRTETYPLGGFASRLALAGLDIAFYLWKTVLPVGLLPMYPRWQVDPPAAVQFLPWAVLAAVFGWLWTKRRLAWAAAALFGLGFFLVNLLPVLGFFRMSFMRISWVSDHFAYVSSLGLIGLAAAALGAWYDRVEIAARAPLRIAGWIALLCLAIASRLQAEVYAGMEPLCRHTIERNPEAWLAHQLYAATIQRKGDYDTALVHAREAVRLRPGVAENQNSLGLALDSKGRFQESLVHLQEAARLAPGNWAIHVNFAKVLVETEHYDEALREYQSLLQRTPQDVALRSNAGACYLGLGRADEAVAEFRRALAIDPSLASVRENLAIAMKQRERQPPALPPPSSR